MATVEPSGFQQRNDDDARQAAGGRVNAFIQQEQDRVSTALRQTEEQRLRAETAILQLAENERLNKEAVAKAKLDTEDRLRKEKLERERLAGENVTSMVTIERYKWFTMKWNSLA